jgi:hypothetical protein
VKVWNNLNWLKGQNFVNHSGEAFQDRPLHHGVSCRYACTNLDTEGGSCTTTGRTVFYCDTFEKPCCNCYCFYYTPACSSKFSRDLGKFLLERHSSTTSAE